MNVEGGPAIYTVIIYRIVEKVQGESLRACKKLGGEFCSGQVTAQESFDVLFKYIELISGEDV